jgi:RNA polymerase sigma factor (sigma-70 family)
MTAAEERFAALQAEDAAEGNKVRAIIHHGLALSCPAVHDIAADTADIEQTVWLKCWEALSGGQRVDSHWLHVVAKHAASQHRTRAQNELARTPYSRDDPEAGYDGVISTPSSTSNRKSLSEYLQGMPDSICKIIREFYENEMSLTEIASQNMISISAAEKRLQRARDAIRGKIVSSKAA